MPVRLIASDLDGTLLLNGAQSLRENTCDLIHALHEKGVWFVASSGRQYDNLRNLFAPVKDEIGYICENGCLSYLGDTRIGRELMDTDIALSLIKDGLAHPEYEILVSGEHTSYILNHPSFYHHMHDVVRNHVTVVDDLSSVPEPYFKISLYDENDWTKENEEIWKNKYGTKVQIMLGGSKWLDIMPKGVTKAAGLLPLLKKLNISPMDIIAIGDNENDKEILKLAGHPIVMSHSHPSIISLSDHRIDQVEPFLSSLLEDL